MTTKKIISKNKNTNNANKNLKKVQDFWAKHNIGTRMMLVIFAVTYIAVVVSAFFGVTIAIPIVNMVWYSALIGFITVTLGANGLEMLLEGIAKIKLGRYELDKDDRNDHDNYDYYDYDFDYAQGEHDRHDKVCTKTTTSHTPHTPQRDYKDWSCKKTTNPREYEYIREVRNPRDTRDTRDIHITVKGGL